ncbi:MAG: hypothetical protein J0I06_23105 [Planctomycetes bacterium]|nr:hypothetical protein [Planctomycetota bacterium]
MKRLLQPLPSAALALVAPGAPRGGQEVEGHGRGKAVGPDGGRTVPKEKGKLTIKVPGGQAEGGAVNSSDKEFVIEFEGFGIVGTP